MATRKRVFGVIGLFVSVFVILLAAAACQAALSPSQANLSTAVGAVGSTPNPFAQRTAGDSPIDGPAADAPVDEVSDNVLSVAELWPDWENGAGAFTVPEGFDAWLTSDPGRLYVLGEEKPLAEFANRTVLLIGSGEYLLETYVSAEGNINGWLEATRVELFTLEAPIEQAVRMHDELGNPAPIVDLRVNPVTAAAQMSVAGQDSEVFIAPEKDVLPESAVVVDIAAEAPAAPVAAVEAPVVAQAPASGEMTCVPDYKDFAIGYDDPNADAVTLKPADGMWVMAGHDPASVNGTKTADKAVTVVAPGHTAEITGLGRDPGNHRAYIYACQLPAEPTKDLIDQWVARESAGGRQVEIVNVK